MAYSTPFDLKKGSFERSCRELTAPDVQEVEQCCAELHNIVRHEDRRIGHLLSLETHDIIRADGSGLRLLGYNPGEWQLYPFITSIPGAYAWIYCAYREMALARINQVQCGNCHFSINIPIQDRNRKKCYWAHVRSWVINYQKPENKPRILLVTIDLLQNWAIDEPPIRCVGEFNNATFPDAMSDFNADMKNRVSDEILNKRLGLQPIELHTVRLMHERLPTQQIANHLHTSIHNVNYFKRQIIRNCRQHLGNLSDAQQWVQYLGGTFNL